MKKGTGPTSLVSYGGQEVGREDEKKKTCSIEDESCLRLFASSMSSFFLHFLNLFLYLILISVFHCSCIPHSYSSYSLEHLPVLEIEQNCSMMHVKLIQTYFRFFYLRTTVAKAEV